MFTKKKPLAFIKKAPAKPDVENAADAKQPGDAKEDAPKKSKGKTANLAKKAAMVLAYKGKKPN